MPRVYSGRDCGRFIEPLIRGARRRLWVVSPFISREYAELLVEKAREGVDVRVVTCGVDESREAIEVLSRGIGCATRVLGAITLSALAAGYISILVIGSQSSPVVWGLFSLALLLGLACSVVLAVVCWRLWLPLLAGVVGATLLVFHVLGLGYSLPYQLIDAVLYQGLASAAALIALRPRPRVRGAHRREVARKPQLKVVPVERMVHSKIYIGDDVAIVGSANLTKSGLWRNYETITIFEGDEVREIEKMFLDIWSRV